MPPTHRRESEKAMSNHERSEFNSGHGVHQHTPNNPNSHVRSSFSSPQKQVIREQRSVIRWSLLHIATAVCLIVGIYYGREYMRMPDRVIVVDEAGSIYRGSSENVLCKETAENIARRCAFAFLDRSFEHDRTFRAEVVERHHPEKQRRIHGTEDPAASGNPESGTAAVERCAGTVPRICLRDASPDGRLHENPIFAEVEIHARIAAGPFAGGEGVSVAGSAHDLRGEIRFRQ